MKLTQGTEGKSESLKIAKQVKLCVCVLLIKFTYFGTCLNNNYIVNKSKILDFHHNLSIVIYIFC